MEQNAKNIYARLWYRTHKTKSLKWKAMWRKKNPHYMVDYHQKHKRSLIDGIRDRAYKSKYGISLQDYIGLCSKQKGLCAICLNPPKKYRLAVDHDHKTNKVRGLLCFPCNRVVIGRIDSIPGFLSRLLRYIK